MKIHGITGIKYTKLNNRYKSGINNFRKQTDIRDSFSYTYNPVSPTSKCSPSFGKKPDNNKSRLPENALIIKSSSLNVLKNPFVSGIIEYKNFIKQLADIDSETLKKKITLLQRAESESKSNFEPSRKFKEFRYILLNKDLSPKGLNSLYSVIKKDKRAKNFNFWGNSTDRLYYLLTESAARYCEFDKMSVSERLALIKDISWDYNYIDESITHELTDIDKFPLFKDLKDCGSIDNLILSLYKKIYEPSIGGMSFTKTDVPEIYIEAFEKSINPKNIEKVFQNFDFDEYHSIGLPLKFTRKDFIQQFKKLPYADELAAYFNFTIDESDDIISFPNTKGNFSSGLSKDAKQYIPQAKKLVEDFTINNHVVMPENEEAQEFFNTIIKAFPELTSIIGKKQNIEHDNTLDIHTFKVIKYVVSHPSFKELKEENKRILIIASLFHDIGKKEGVVDYEHPQKSAVYTKELMKKLKLNSLEKEKLFNLIDTGHWAQYMSNGSKTAQDIAAIFRHPDDFKMAKIFSYADLISVSENLYERLKDIQKDHAANVEKALNDINRKGIVLFADDIGDSYSNLNKSDDGVYLIDFTDKNSDVSYLGYPKGTKVKDLKMLAHSSNTSPKEFNMECRPEHKICLSASLLDEGNFRTLYNSKTHVIIKPVNSDIAIVSKGLCSPGFQRGFDEFKKYLFETSRCNLKATTINPDERRMVSDMIKEHLNIDSDEYAQMYEKLADLNNLNDINDIILPGGKTILKEDIISAIKQVQNFLLKEIDPREYKNEVVVFNPKIAAFVEESKKYESNSELKQTARENNIPVILI